MVRSRSTLSRAEIVRAVTDLLGPDAVDTDEARLRAASVDRFRKYTAVHGIYDGPVPAAIVYPASTEQVAQLLELAQRERVAVVPRTGGTSTEGGLETVVEDSLVVDGSRMDRILEVDVEDMQATVQCGVPLQVLEDALRAQGLTTGHSPQSKPIAQLGGLVATRSIGQFSTLYGGIEDMVVGLEAVLPGGRGGPGPQRAPPRGRTRRAPRADRQRGRAGLRHRGHRQAVPPLPGRDPVVRVPGAGLRGGGGAAARGRHRRLPALGRAALLPRGRPPALPRPPARPEPRRALRGGAAAPGRRHRRRDRGDGGRGRPHPRCRSRRSASWFEALNWGADKIEAEKQSMRESAHLGYTTEVSVDWSRTAELYEATMARIRTTFDRVDDLTLLGAHSSHSYQTGTNLYFVYDYDIRCEPREEIDLYHRPLNAIIVEEALRVGGSMVHHHGVGKYRTPWIRQEHGSSYALLAGLKRAFDPDNVMNPGSVFPVDADGDAVLDETLMVAFLAIDSGSQSTKVSVVDEAGTVHASAAAPLRPYELGPGGRAVHPDDDLWDALAVAAARGAGVVRRHRRRGRGGRAVRDPVLPGAARRRRPADRAGAELDGRPGGGHPSQPVADGWRP